MSSAAGSNVPSPVEKHAMPPPGASPSSMALPGVWGLAVLVAVAILGGVAGALITLDGELRKALYGAVLMLVYGALLAGIVKLLIDDHDRLRIRLAEEVQFIVNVLSDLKSVYDQVESARLVIVAHESALTYGKEMRGLIEARVKLLNVDRALQSYAKGEELAKVKPYVNSMADYLAEVVQEFQNAYKKISDAQKAHEARTEGLMNRLKQNPDAKLEIGETLSNDPWSRIQALPILQTLLVTPVTNRRPAAEESATTVYEDRFSDPLDKASRLLREELARTLH